MNAKRLLAPSAVERARYRAVSISCLMIFAGAIFVGCEKTDQQVFYDATKEEFMDKFDEFKKEGLTEKQVKQLTDKLLEVAGDKIDGTGTKTLLKAMNKQAKNTTWIMQRKAASEKLIGFVGDVYAIALSDAPPDPMDAYKELDKGVDLAAQLADNMLGLNVTAVPMLKAYSQAIKNGEKHIDAIAAATRAKNSAIELAWESMDHDEVLAVTEMDEIEDDEPDDRDLPPSPLD